MFWEPIASNIWQGRDDSAESPQALRLFQTVAQAQSFAPEKYPHQIALLGFACDEGVSLNKGRIGARDAPDEIRKAMANMASYPAHEQLVDFGNVYCVDHQLAEAQESLAKHVLSCHQHGLKTLVLGGGHETAFGHGLGVYRAYPEAKVGIINFDAHLDIREADIATSGTPFKQLANYCQAQNRPFEYMCVGASLAANTQALLQIAEDLHVRIIWDLDCRESLLDEVSHQIQTFIDSVDIIYLTIDLDVLASSEMFAVSAPAALGIPLSVLLLLSEQITQSNKLKALDLVEYNPVFDSSGLCAKAAARAAWQLCLKWHS